MSKLIREVLDLVKPEECKEFLEMIKPIEEITQVNKENFNGYQVGYPNIDSAFLSMVDILVDIEVDKYIKAFPFMTRRYKRENGILLKLQKDTPLGLHYDSEDAGDGQVRHFTTLLYLQDLPDGKLYFPMQERLIDIRPGKLVIFPTFYTHPHAVFPSTVDRYAYRINYFVL